MDLTHFIWNKSNMELIQQMTFSFQPKLYNTSNTFCK